MGKGDNQLISSSGSFAVLTEHRRWRFVVFFMLCVAQGIPFGLIAVALPAYMAQRGVDALTMSAFLGICLLPHAIKLVNGPIMDRCTPTRPYLPCSRYSRYSIDDAWEIPLAAAIRYEIIP